MKQEGYIALISVMIIGAASLAIATALLITGVDAQQENLARQQMIQARQAASGCAEEALQQIRDNTAFTGSNSLTLGSATCSYTVTNTGASTRTVIASSTIGSVVRKVQAYVTINVSSLSISAWTDVP
jgi:hypothetical protein